MTTRTISRRNLLRAAAAGAATLPLAGLHSTSQAADGDTPKRIIFMLSPNGMAMSDWRPTGNAAGWSLSPILEPLADLKDEIIVLDGVDNEASHHTQGEAMQSGHHAVASLWSGTVPVPSGDVYMGTGITIDQYLASRIEGTPFPSLVTGVMIHPDATFRTRASYSGPGSFVEPDTNPYDLLARVFGNPDVSEEEAALLLAQRQVLLGSLRADLAEIEDRSRGDDRRKVQDHLVAVDQLEDQLIGVPCEAPVIEPGRNLSYSNYTELPYATKATMDILVAALACDATRVATLHLTQENSNATYDFLNLGTADTRHHVLSHAYPEDPGYADFSTINRWHCSQFAYLLEQLRSIPEGDGTMLDNTLVVWTSNMSKGYRHEGRNLPIVLGGNLGGYFETGRWHQWGDYQLDVNSHDPHGGRTMNDLLITLCHAMGFTDVETFGDPAFCTGPLL